jgi:uncharacterized protein YaaQ
MPGWEQSAARRRLPMKLIIAIVRDEDSENISHALIDCDFRVTRIASTGGFLRRGNTTLMIGVEDEKVDEAIQLIRTNSTSTVEKGMKRATLFVINIENFEQV